MCFLTVAHVARHVVLRRRLHRVAMSPCPFFLLVELKVEEEDEQLLDVDHSQVDNLEHDLPRLGPSVGVQTARVSLGEQKEDYGLDQVDQDIAEEKCEDQSLNEPVGDRDFAYTWILFAIFLDRSPHNLL